jgi:dTDP-4-amino-4,6-dideoxygalactose transaminase
LTPPPWPGNFRGLSRCRPEPCRRPLPSTDPCPVPLLDLRAQHAAIRDDVVAAMMAVVDAQAFILGEPVAALEREVAALSHARHAIGCASGTDALLLALRAVDAGPGTR